MFENGLILAAASVWLIVIALGLSAFIYWLHAGNALHFQEHRLARRDIEAFGGRIDQADEAFWKDALRAALAAVAAVLGLILTAKTPLHRPMLGAAAFLAVTVIVRVVETLRSYQGIDDDFRRLTGLDLCKGGREQC